MSRTMEESRHPAEDGLAAYIEGTLDAAAVDDVESHLARCTECRAALVEIRALEEVPRVPVPADLLALASKPAPRFARTARWALAAAILVAAVLSGRAWLASRDATGARDQDRRYRDSSGVGIALFEPASGSRVERGDVIFRWTPVSGADSYVVTVRTPEGRTVVTLEAPGGATEARWLPQDGARYLWSVRALSRGRPVAESRPSSFEVR